MSKLGIYIPTLPLKDSDILQFQPLIKTVTNRTCKKMNPFGYFGLNEASKLIVLNILGQTYEDVYQELMIETTLGISKFLKTSVKNYKPEFKDYFELAFYNYVKKCLQRRAGKLISNMWMVKAGQAIQHVYGPDADMYFLGLSPTEVANDKK